MKADERDDNLKQAFAAVNRADFVPPAYRLFADQDRPLPIGNGQTISQPSTVYQMLGWLDIRPGQTVLDVGSGSGWTTALLSHLVGPKGRVYAIEIIEQLLEQGRRNCEKLGLTNVEFCLPDKPGGLAAHAPYDRILVSASAPDVPSILKEQLKPGGIMVVPVGTAILTLSHTSQGWQKQRHEGYVFVPYVAAKQ